MQGISKLRIAPLVGWKRAAPVQALGALRNAEAGDTFLGSTRTFYSAPILDTAFSFRSDGSAASRVGRVEAAMRPDGLPRRQHFDNWQRTPPVSTEPPKPPEPLTGGVKYQLSETCTLVMWKGDIVIWHVDGQTDAIVAPANKKVNAGLGINGAIHRAAGPRLADAGAKLPDMAPQGVKCNVGSAVITRAFNLKVSRVIHAVAPVYQAKEESARDLSSAYKNALDLANKEGIKYICFAAMSCGLYAYPYDEAAEIALTQCLRHHSAIREVHFVLKEQDYYDTWLDESKRIFKS